MKYSDKLKTGIDSYRELQSILNNKQNDPYIKDLGNSYLEAYLKSVEKIVKIASRLEKANSEIEEISSKIHGLIIHLQDRKEGLYGEFRIQKN